MIQRREDMGSFNSAAVVLPRKATSERAVSRDHAQLQFGRGCSTAERAHDAAGEHAPVRASIRPRLFYRGKINANAESFRLLSASIRPRLFYRGKAAGWARWSPSTARLQFGRGCSTAESPASGAKAIITRGFNSAAVVLPRKVGFHRRTKHDQQCFNSAAVVLPRKDADRAPAKVFRGALQFGRGCSTAERQSPPK